MQNVPTEINENHKSGFVNIIGLPNAGKSTLMNAFMDEKIAIITPKPQTTRHRIIGIVNDDNYQIIFSDTPGIVKPHHKLHQKMMTFVDSALQDADVFVYLIDCLFPEVDAEVISKIKQLNSPYFLAINKIDKINSENLQIITSKLKSEYPDAIIFTLSAKEKIGVTELKTKIVELLPIHPPFYPKDDNLSDKNIRFFVSEIIREKIFLNYSEEIPYSCEVYIEQYKEKENIVVISATIFVERESQKAILIGHKGKAIKNIGVESRLDIEKFIDSKVFLELSVKVKPNWREDETQLDRFGYRNI